jgi:dihydrofolate reductase
MSKPRVTLIAAMNQRRVIGREGDMPWHLPADLKHFRRHTEGKPVVMGRRTYASIGRPLPNRRNLVLSRRGFDAVGVEVFAELQQALDACRGADEIMVIGGGEIYRQALPLASRIVLTRIDNELDGDTVFPEFEGDGWQRCRAESHAADDKHAWSMVFEEWEKTA